MTSRHIFAMGGAALDADTDYALVRAMLDISGASNPRVLFVGTASAESPDYVMNFYRAMSAIGVRGGDLSLFRREVGDLDDYVGGFDAVFVGGGNTANMLAIWRTHGFDTVLRGAYERGTVLGGESAGAICWYEACTTDSFGGVAAMPDGLGWLGGSCTPHYHGEELRRPTVERALREGSLVAGVAIDDGVGLHYVDESIAGAVGVPGAGAWHVSAADDGDLVERAIEVAPLIVPPVRG